MDGKFLVSSGEGEKKLDNSSQKDITNFVSFEKMYGFDEFWEEVDSNVNFQ